MNQEIRNDFNIFGIGYVPGGTYNRVGIKGDGTVHGDVDCLEMNIKGRGSLSGNLKTAYCQVVGEVTIKGSMEGENIHIRGKVNVNAGIKGKKMLVLGMADVNGEVNVEKIETKGGLNVKADCNAEILELKGVFAIDGLLNAGNLTIETYGSCRAKEIGGEKVVIRQGKAPGFWGSIKEAIFPAAGEEVTVETIEGDEIYLEGVRAKVVRGCKVNLGPNCDIKLVEYRTEYHQDQRAKVGEQRQI